jgi:hypothetical protein
MIAAGSRPAESRERTTRRAVAAAVAREHGLPVEDQVVLHDLFSVRVHLPPAPVVARVPTAITRLSTDPGGAARELAVVDFRPDFGDLPGWDEGVRGMLAGLED